MLGQPGFGRGRNPSAAPGRSLGERLRVQPAHMVVDGDDRLHQVAEPGEVQLLLHVGEGVVRGGSSGCSAAERASSGCGWTSTMTPSAPTATPPIASGLTSQRFPVAWLGATITGGGGRRSRSGPAARSIVFRV